MYSANNQPDSIAGMLYPGYYLPENRAKRIRLLEPKDDWDNGSVSEMMLDVTSSVNPAIVSDLVKMIDVSVLTPEQLKMLDMLNLWQGDYPLESIAATIYTRWEYYVLENTFKDELGGNVQPIFKCTHFNKRVIAPMAGKNENSVWWDNVTTPETNETESRYYQCIFYESVAFFGN